MSNLLSCPKCDSELLTTAPAGHPSYVKYICKEVDCRFVFSVARAQLLRHDVPAPFPFPAKSSRVLTRGDTNRTVRVTVAGRNT
jgi:hypothetical protein